MSKRFNELDSLRGLAAVVVLFLHMYLTLQGSNFSKFLFEYSPLRLLISGGESVILFFVLSGFVLSLPYYDNKQTSYLSFVLKRICRIYIPYIFAIVVAIGCKDIFYTGKIESLSNWFNSFWADPVHLKLVLDHILLIDTFLSNLNPVVWSLVHEMRISIIFPILMLILVRLDGKTGLGLGLLCSMIGVLTFYIFKPADTGTQLAASISYIAMFLVGALLAKYRDAIQRRFICLSGKVRISIFVTGLLMYLYVHPSLAIKIFIFPNIPPFYRTVIDSWTITLGAAILIIFSLNSTVLSGILRIKMINFLGKISYSLYLIHVVILFVCIHVLHRLIPIWSIYIVALLGTLVSSSLMYYLIEKPSIKLGRVLTSKKKIIKRNIVKEIDQQLVR